MLDTLTVGDEGGRVCRHAGRSTRRPYAAWHPSMTSYKVEPGSRLRHLPSPDRVCCARHWLGVAPQFCLKAR